MPPTAPAVVVLLLLLLLLLSESEPGPEEEEDEAVEVVVAAVVEGMAATGLQASIHAELIANTVTSPSTGALVWSVKLTSTLVR
jgi:hypothetical protein